MDEFYTSSSDSSSTSEDDEDIFVRRRKIYKERKNYFEIYDDIDFFDRFRLTKPTFTFLLNEIEREIQSATNRGGCIKPVIQLLLTLRFYASGSILVANADFVGVSEASASRIITRVSTAIARLSNRYIKMYEEEHETEEAAVQFYRIASFPRVIGAIDCTLIKIQYPGGDDTEIFRSRKGFFALNVQTVSDAGLKIRNIVCRWPGSVHDQTIFNNCNLKMEFEDLRYGRYLLIGDSGYRLERYLMTKLETTRSPADILYNESIIRTRNVVERQYGVWKRRFPILSLGIRLNVNTAMTVIVATAVLHNIALDMQEDIPLEWNIVDVHNLNNEAENDNIIENQSGRQVRQLLITEHFNRL